MADAARILLAAIRVVNGTLALVAPGFLSRQIGIDPDANPGVKYVFRMFGIRTVLIGIELLVRKGDRRAEALSRAVLIHASDTLAAGLASLSVGFPPKSRAIVGISALNTILAVIAKR